MLTGNRALIIEQEFLIALEIQGVLEQAGVEEVELFSSVHEAEPHWERISSVNLAVIEGRLGAPAVIEFTTKLTQAGVAVVVASADRGLAELFPHARFVEKPFDAETLRAACVAARVEIS